MKKFWCSFFLMICLVFWSSFAVFALNIPVLNQHSSQEILGTCDGCTIYSDGCAVTSLAMVLQFFNFNNLTVPAEQSETGSEKIGLSPSIVDDWLLWKNGYSYCDPSPPTYCTCPGDCMMRWSNLYNILPGLSVSGRQDNNSATGIDEQTYNFIDRALSNNRPVIARVNNFHFVVITSRNGDTYNINDPWNGVQTTLEAGELGSYHINHCRYFSGSLVRCIEDPEQRIYWLQNGKLYWITDMSVISAMSSILGWSETQDFPERDFNIENYSHWPNVPRFISQSSDSNGLLIKLPDDSKIYLIENGERRWITSEDVFNKQGYDWNDIITVTPAILALIPEGDPIYSATRTMNFEDGTDRHPIRSKIPGLQFTTTDGYDWIYGDWRAGYNGPYPNGSYFSNGNFFAWLGVNQGTGRIDFIGATATYLSVLTSTYSGLTMDAYDINDNWLATSGWATNNLNTGQMTRLTVSAPNMAYVLVHDTGNYWLIDDLEIGDLLAEAKAYLPASFIAEYEDLDTLNQDQSKWKTFFNEIYQTIKIILGWGGSELSIQIYNPDGVLYGEYQSDTPPIIIDIPDAEPGQWQFKITAIDVPKNNYPFALVVGIPDATRPNTPPIADAGPDQTVAVGAGCMAAVTLDGSGSSDPDGDSLTYTWTWEGGSATGASPSIQLPLGAFAITLMVNDGTADSDPDMVNINVVDQTPPDISLTVSPDTLWPPNHKMVLITPIITVTDNCDSEPALVLASITMNEGEETNAYDPNYDLTIGDGHTTDDIQVDESGNIYLRAERSGAGNGRIYTVTYSATDASGNTSSASAVVSVPHNQ